MFSHDPLLKALGGFAYERGSYRASFNFPIAEHSHLRLLISYYNPDFSAMRICMVDYNEYESRFNEYIRVDASSFLYKVSEKSDLDLFSNGF